MALAELNIYAYTGVADFLRDFYRWRKATFPAFSYRQFAATAQVPSSLLQDVIAGRRPLSERAAEKFGVAMKLGKRRTEYLVWMTRFEKAKKPDAKNEAFAQMCRYRSQAKMKFLGKDAFMFYTQWQHSAVRLLVTLPEFQESPAWIARALHPRISEKQAAESLSLLLDLGLLRRDARRRLQLSDGIITTDYDLESMAVQRYNRKMMEMGIAALESIPREQREVSTLQCSVSLQGFRRIQERLRRFKEDVMEIAVTEQADPEAVYHMNLQLFPLTVLASQGRVEDKQ